MKSSYVPKKRMAAPWRIFFLSEKERMAATYAGSGGEVVALTGNTHPDDTTKRKDLTPGCIKPFHWEVQLLAGNIVDHHYHGRPHLFGHSGDYLPAQLDVPGDHHKVAGVHRSLGVRGQDCLFGFHNLVAGRASGRGATHTASRRSSSVPSPITTSSLKVTVPSTVSEDSQQQLSSRSLRIHSPRPCHLKLGRIRHDHVPCYRGSVSGGIAEIYSTIRRSGSINRKRILRCGVLSDDVGVHRLGTTVDVTVE